MLGIAGLISAYILLALLLVSLNLYTKWSWRIKSLMILIVSSFYIMTYISFTPLMGWPTNDKLPERFELISSYVLEPNKKSGKVGQIFLWVTDLRDSPLFARPRAYSLPYSVDMNEKVASATLKVRKGKPQIGEMEVERLGSYNERESLSQNKPKAIAIQFFDLPDPSVPSK